MFFKLTIDSQMYEEEKIAILLNTNSGTVKIGGRCKLEIEIKRLMEELNPKPESVETKVYSNQKQHFKFEYAQADFFTWIETLKSRNIKVTFVKSLGRIMR